MLIAGLPVEAGRIHHLLRGWVRLALLRRDARACRARFNFLYFSYAPDAQFLELSLRTLCRAVPQSLRGGVFLAEDQKAPFAADQIHRLRQLVPDLHLMPVRDFEWGSPRSTHAELGIFEQVCRSLPDARDFLVKVDSDVLFLPNPKWERLLRSEADAIGDGHFLQFRYAQGGLYMMRRQLVQEVLSRVTLADVERVARAIDSVGEDMAVSRILEESGHPFLFTRLMLFPDEYRRVRRVEGAVKREFVALHCHRDKAAMAELCTRMRLLGPEETG